MAKVVHSKSKARTAKGPRRSLLLKPAEALPLNVKQAESILKQMGRIFSQELFRTTPNLVKHCKSPRRQPTDEVAPTGIITVDETGTIRSFSVLAEQIFGCSAAEVLERNIAAALEPLGTMWATFVGSSTATQPCSRAPMTRRLLAKRWDGQSFLAEITLNQAELEGKRITIVVVRDVGEQEKAETEQRKTEARFRSLVEQIPAVTFTGSLEDGLSELYVSPQIEGLLGFSQEEWLSNPFLWFSQLHPEDRELCNREFARGCATGGPFRADFRALTRAGEVVWIHGEAMVVRDEDGRPLCIQGVAYDITESKRAEQAMQAHAEHIQSSLAEKEVLLKEIHHRVKNNLQVISSLLKLQSEYIQDSAALQVFRESCNRIQSMALVHEKLYQSADLSQIDFKEYARSLTDLILRSYREKIDSVTLRTQIDDVFLSIDLAAPLGLIINELVSNCLKYAFPNHDRGRVDVTLRSAGQPRSYLLTVSDDGIGLPCGFDPHNTSTLGMQLVSMLTEQIAGSLELRSNPGTEFRISFQA
jgi:PAS domain S-box-containing protein